MTKTTRNWLILIVSMCALVRLVHFGAVVQTAFVDFPLHAVETDMYAYWEWSETIIDGDWLGRETYHPKNAWMVELGDEDTWHRWWGGSRIFQQEPVYPYLVAMGRSLGLSIAGLLLVQLLIGSLQPLVTFWLTRMVFRRDAVALISAAVAGFYGPLIFSQGTLLRDWTGPLLESLVLLALLHAHHQRREWSWFWPGVVFGIALMTRSAVLAFLPFMFLWIGWVNRDRVSHMVRRGGIAAAGVLIGFAPLMVRNLLLGVAPFRITNRMPEGIISGNAADTSPLGMTVPQSMPGILEISQGSAFVAMLESVKSHQSDWLGFLELQWLKFRALIDPFEIPNNLSYAYGQDISPVLSLMPGYGWLLPLGFLGLALVIAGRRIDYRHGLMLSFGFATLLALMAGLILGRYRLALTTFMFVYAGWAVWELWHRVSTHQYRRLALPGLVLAGVFVLQQVYVPIPALRQSMFFMFHPLSHQTASEVYLGRGRPDLAVAEWARMQWRAEQSGHVQAIDAAVERQQSLHFRLAMATAGTGRTSSADWHLSEVERLFEARADQRMRDFALGIAYFNLGRTSEALRKLEQFIADYPEFPEAEQAREVILQINNGRAGGEP